MSLIRDPSRHGRVIRFWAAYRRLRRDQAPNAPITMRMDRRYAVPIAWRQSRGV